MSRKICLLSIREYERIQRGEFPNCEVDHPHKTKRQIVSLVAAGEAKVIEPGRLAVRVVGRTAPVNLYRNHLATLAAVGMTEGHQVPDRKGKRKCGWHPAPPRPHLRPESPDPLPVILEPNREGNRFSP